MRACANLGKRKVAHLDRVPYLLARLDQPGIRDRCLEQWQEVSAAEHDLVTREFLDPSMRLRSFVDDIGDDGTIPSVILRYEVKSIQNVKMDDTVNEAPHAVAEHVARRNVQSNWAWIASSARLEQNLDDIQSLSHCCDLQTEWDRYTSVLQVSDIKARRSKKMKPREAYAQVYFMSHFSCACADLFDEDGADDDDHGGVDGDGNAPAAAAIQAVISVAILNQAWSLGHWG